MAFRSFIAKITIPQPRIIDYHYDKIKQVGDQLFFVREDKQNRKTEEKVRLQTVVGEAVVSISCSILNMPVTPFTDRDRVDDELTLSISDLVLTFKDALSELQKSMISLQQHQIRLDKSVLALQQAHGKLVKDVQAAEGRLKEEVSLLWDESIDHRRCTKPVTDRYQSELHARQLNETFKEFEKYVDSRHELRTIPQTPVLSRRSNVQPTEVKQVKSFLAVLDAATQKRDAALASKGEGEVGVKPANDTQPRAPSEKEAAGRWSPPLNYFTED